VPLDPRKDRETGDTLPRLTLTVLTLTVFKEYVAQPESVTLNGQGAGEMRVMIVAAKRPRSVIWAQHLERVGARVTLAEGQEDAISCLHELPQDVVIIDLGLQDGGALALSDFISYRHPMARVIFISDGRFFSDGSIFAHCGNACAYLPLSTPAADIAALAEHHAGHGSMRERHVPAD